MEPSTLLSLPAEIRTEILEHVFADQIHVDGFSNRNVAGGITLDEKYKASDVLRVLLICRQLYHDAALIALRRTAFAVNSLYISNNIPDRLAVLHPKQLSALRNIAFVADAVHFRKLNEWGEYPWGLQRLNLDSISIVLHRSSFWHYLFDYTSDITRLLRRLKGVRRLIFVRNEALVKGSFKTWYNRLIGLMMKVDHQERYLKDPPRLEQTWWTWSYDDLSQSFCLESAPPKAFEDEATYMEQIAPLMEAWTVSVENEEWNPDPRARNAYY